MSRLQVDATELCGGFILFVQLVPSEINVSFAESISVGHRFDCGQEIVPRKPNVGVVLATIEDLFVDLGSASGENIYGVISGSAEVLEESLNMVWTLIHFDL